MSQYIRGGEIGRGASSVVYKAVDTVTGETVAIKVFAPDAGIPKLEILISRMVTHLNVIRTFEHGEEPDGTQWIVMEYAGGGNLRAFIERHPRGAPIEECLRLVWQILDALEAAHRKTIVHRDLKPENILLMSDGTVKVSDFGHARFFGTPLTAESQRSAGTPPYMAPEQDRGPVDARADIHAFGFVLLELLSGRCFGPDGSLNLPESVPAHVKATVQKCVEYDPDRRFASVSELRTALESPQPQRRPWRTKVTLAALAGLLLFAAVAFRYNIGQRPPAAADVRGLPVIPALIRPEAPLLPDRPKAISRVAILDFDNLTGDKSLDPYTVGIPETLRTELAQVRGLTLIDRNQMNDPGHDPSAKPAQLAQILGADAVITGSFQKVGDSVQLNARVFDADTGVDVRAPAAVNGAVADLFKLQAELGKQVAAAIGAGSAKLPAEGRSADAFHAFSDGLYFLKNDLPADALPKFDAALKLDPDYPGAQHYRGVTLAKLHRTDEAIEAFKQALPRSEPDRLIAWSWDAPFTGAGPHGRMRILDNSRMHIQSSLFAGQRVVPVQQQIIYGERDGQATVLHFLDLVHHSAQRVEFPDPKVLLDASASGNESVILIPSGNPLPKGPADLTALSAFASDGSRLWRLDFQDDGNVRPQYAALGDAVYVYFPALLRFDLLDARTGKLRWRRDGLRADGAEAPLIYRTKRFGEILVVKSGDTYRAMRKSDGTDAWTLPVQSPQASEMAAGRALIVFEPERRIFTVDPETGRTTGEVQIEQFADALPNATTGPKWIVGALLQGNVLYVFSNKKQLCAVDLDKHRILWRTPLQPFLNKKIESMQAHGSRLYVGTDQGQVIVMDTTSGAIRNLVTLGGVEAGIDYAGNDVVIARANGTLFGLTEAGERKWEFPKVQMNFTPVYFKGTVIAATSEVQLTAIDLRTGSMGWQYVGSRQPYIYKVADRLFILDGAGVKEYTPEGSKPDGVTEKETLTELAGAYLANRDLQQARLFAGKAAELDGNYPAVVQVRAQLAKAEGRTVQAGKELARYASLVGIDSNEGQKTIAQMKRDYGLVWESGVGINVAGDPVVVGGRLVSEGRKVAPDVQMLGLDANNGAVVWRYRGERFAASALGDGALWYVTGSKTDLGSVVLYRVDVKSGERKIVSGWREDVRVDHAWLAYAAGRVFVASVSPDLNASKVGVVIDAFDAPSGQRLWEKKREQANPIRIFAADAGGVATGTWKLRTTDGAELPAPKGPTAADKTVPVASLWPPLSFRMQDGRLYAFTGEGRAFAMQCAADCGKTETVQSYYVENRH